MENQPKTIHTQLLEFQKKNISIPRKGKGNISNREYKYATLDDVILVVRPILTELGLYITQIVSDENLVTKIIHAESGVGLSSTLPLGKPTGPQDLGTRISYFRRYAIISLLGLSTEEDVDGIQTGGGLVGSTPIISTPASPMPLVKKEEIKEAITLDGFVDEVRKEGGTQLNAQKDPLVPTVKKEVVQPSTQQELPLTPITPETYSPGMQKAVSAIDSCQNLLAIKEIEKNIETSVRLTAQEKAALKPMVLLKIDTLNGTANQ